MDLCIVAPRFHPVIGGAEEYLKNLAIFCSKYIKTTVVTSNLKSPINLFEKHQYIEKIYDIIPNNIEIIRCNTLHNTILRYLFIFNQFLNGKFENLFDKLLNPNLYDKFKHTTRINQNLSKITIKSLIYQRLFINPNFLQIYFILKKINNIQRIKIIHSSPIFLTANNLAFQFSKKKKIPFICTPLYNINPYSNYTFLPSFQHILKNSDAVIACTNLEKNFYRKFGINKNKIYVIPPGIDPNNYKNTNVKKFKNRYKIPENAPLLFFMARRTYEKGFFQAIYSLKYLIRKFKDIKLMIAGPMSRNYKLIFNRLPKELKTHIIDLGFIDNDTKTDAFASCDVFILPSLDDAFGIVYLEAWRARKPVIGAIEGNVADVIDDNINGFLVSFKKIKNLALKIEFLIKNKKKRDELGQNGYYKLIKNYSLKTTNEQMLNLYKKFI